MSVLVSIGDFSRMTHLSIKALRFYHDQGLLEPARIDSSSGYRFYEPGQVPVAQVIRRFRDLDMPLDQVRAVLRALLEGPPTRPDVEFRSIPATPAPAVRATVTAAESWAWGAGAFEEIYGQIAASGLSPAGPGGALFPAGFFELEQAELTAFVPVPQAPRVDGRVQALTIPGVEAAVMLHSGPVGDIDQTYGRLG